MNIRHMCSRQTDIVFTGSCAAMLLTLTQTPDGKQSG